MTQPALAFDAPVSRLSLVCQLAQFFREHEGVWIDGRELAKIAGAYAWRSRCSDLRRAPFHLTIENRQRHLEDDKGQPYTRSEYRLVRAQGST